MFPNSLHFGSLWESCVAMVFNLYFINFLGTEIVLITHAPVDV